MKKIFNIALLLNLISLPALADLLVARPEDFISFSLSEGNFIGKSYLLFLFLVISFSIFFMFKLKIKWWIILPIYQTLGVWILLGRGLVNTWTRSLSRASRWAFYDNLSFFVNWVTIAVWGFIAILSLFLVFRPKTRKMSIYILVISLVGLSGHGLIKFISERLYKDAFCSHYYGGAKAACEEKGEIFSYTWGMCECDSDIRKREGKYFCSYHHGAEKAACEKRGGEFLLEGQECKCFFDEKEDKPTDVISQ